MRASLPPRFPPESPSELLDTVRGSIPKTAQTRRYAPDPEYSYSAEEFLRRVRRGNAPAVRQPQPQRPRTEPSFGRSTRRASADPLIGQKVRHPEYGVGTIIGVEGDEDDRRLSVTFPGRGTRKFIERYAHLQQV